MKRPRVIVELSPETMMDWTKYYGPLSEEDVLYLPILPEGWPAQQYQTEDIDDVEKHIENRKNEITAWVFEFEKKCHYIGHLFSIINIDWTLLFQYDSKWDAWLSTGPGKLFRLYIPGSGVFKNPGTFFDYVDGEYFPLDTDYFILNLPPQESLCLLLIMELITGSKGECFLYKELRERIGIPYDWDQLELSLDLIEDLICKYDFRSFLKSLSALYKNGKKDRE